MTEERTQLSHLVILSVFRGYGAIQYRPEPPKLSCLTKPDSQKRLNACLFPFPTFRSLS
jgi:hypothetical protein